MPRRIPILMVAALLTLTGCGRAISHAYTTQTTIPPEPTVAVTTPTLPVAPPTPITITGAAFDLHTSGTVPDAAFKAAWAGVLDTLNRYLEAGVLTPLRTGGPAGDLRPLFTKPAADRVLAVSPDRFAFIDENLPPVSDLRSDASVAGLTGLAGPDGVMSVVTAGLDLRLVGHVDGGPVTVVRTGELVLVPEGGAWRIDEYDVKVVRTVVEATTSTTAHS